jgi:hypothetical protein
MNDVHKDEMEVEYKDAVNGLLHLAHPAEAAAAATSAKVATSRDAAADLKMPHREEEDETIRARQSHNPDEEEEEQEDDGDDDHEHVEENQYESTVESSTTAATNHFEAAWLPPHGPNDLDASVTLLNSPFRDFMAVTARLQQQQQQQQMMMEAATMGAATWNNNIPDPMMIKAMMMMNAATNMRFPPPLANHHPMNAFSMEQLQQFMAASGDPRMKMMAFHAGMTRPNPNTASPNVGEDDEQYDDEEQQDDDDNNDDHQEKETAEHIFFPTPSQRLSTMHQRKLQPPQPPSTTLPPRPKKSTLVQPRSTSTPQRSPQRLPLPLSRSIQPPEKGNMGPNAGSVHNSIGLQPPTMPQTNVYPNINSIIPQHHVGINNYTSNNNNNIINNHHHATTNFTTATNTPNSTNPHESLPEVLASNKKAVYFGWIRHPSTKKWRDVIKRFSGNRQENPSWSEEVFDKIKAAVRAEGIEKYCICRKGGGDVANGNLGPLMGQYRQLHHHHPSSDNGVVETKKIFDKHKRNLGFWDTATEQEVLDRTKQRFIDDRKPQPIVIGVKRPRGRPPKQFSSRESSLDQADPKSIFVTLNDIVMQCNGDLQQLMETSSPNANHDEVDGNNHQAEESEKESLPKQQQEQQQQQLVAALSSHIEPSMLLELMRNLEQAQRYVQQQAETNLANSVAAANKSAMVEEDSTVSSHNSEDGGGGGGGNEAVDVSSEEPPRKRGKDMQNGSNAVTTKRKPWSPILSNHVLFEMNHHPGTIQWEETVKIFSDNTSDYPEWNHKVVDLVQEKMAKNGCYPIFLVFRNSQGKPCVSIREGLWYLATQEEITEQTKRQFLENRQVSVSKEG